ncbi:PREDICTED: eukaryotic translation initiation factor 3 subunit G-like [Wasmannia auropunctata]|uniref:eukaryotic translation initiation factor 3 subunit G-like n=1 Tax=Wasmannia auropunctata TaxID=64793 RepID=UPI0005F08F06|nr:PREDICTED: eukaryotic translation initiation factor 3 subunit G-like [Wasmannia auropunctata]
MPVKSEIKSSWADEVEEEGTLPPPSTVYENGFKIHTEYKYNEEDKRVKIVCTYKIERRIVSKTIAARKDWKKFGDSADDGPGPNPATTLVGEEVVVQFISSKEEENKVEEDSLDRLKNMGDKGVVKCRNCNGDHWTSKCPYRDTAAVLTGGKLAPDEKSLASEAKSEGGKYVPPGMRDGASKRGDSMMQRRDDAFAIRIANLSQSTTDADLDDLVRPFGSVVKQYLAKETKLGNLCKGFAYVHFRYRADAQKAIDVLNGYGYDHLILSVEWSNRPQI